MKSYLTPYPSTAEQFIFVNEGDDKDNIFLTKTECKARIYNEPERGTKLKSDNRKEQTLGRSLLFFVLLF